MTSKELSEVYKYVTGKTFKLSELVEGWPEKEDGHWTSYNEGLEACDKEVMVDEDYLIKVIWEEDEKNGGPGLSNTRQIASAIAQNIKGIIKVKNEMV